MVQHHKYPIGIQTFEKVIDGGYLYIDKTELIYNLIKNGDYYFLSRPRRFGKSMLISTLEAYFQGKKDLFKGLFIEQKEKDWESYPVFHLDFSAATYNSVSVLNNRLNVVFDKWEKLYGKNDVEKEFGDRWMGLIERAFEKTGKQVVILIDEYDKPLTDTIGNNELQEQFRAMLQGIYGILKNADRNIRFAFLTGVTQYGKLGIFSANNNPNDISMVPAYSAICGITEAELHQCLDDDVESLAQALSLSKADTFHLLKRKYDGYHFCEKTEDIYNPFSLLKALDNQRIANFWFATGTPSYLVKLMKKTGFDVAQLDSGIRVTDESLCSFGNGDNNIVAALYQGGYLTIKKADNGVYTLGLPNEEVADGLSKNLIPDFANTNIGDFDPEIIELRDLVRAGDANGMMEQLQTIMEEIPFENNEPKMIEAHFRNMVYLMIRATGYPTHVEMPKLGGRIDICFETEQFAYIIECKRDTSAADALMQINEKKYVQRLGNTGKTRYTIGANFSTKSKNLSEWQIKSDKMS